MSKVLSAAVYKAGLIRYSTTANQLGSPLLKLPAEFRNMIYMLLFRESVFVMQRKPHSAHHLQRTGLSALHTCRQIHEEVRLVPFSVATFSFYNPEHLRNWLKIQNISSEKSSAISRLELDYYAYWGISQTNGFLWQPDSVIPDWWTSSGIAVKTLLPSLRHTKMFFSSRFGMG